VNLLILDVVIVLCEFSTGPGGTGGKVILGCKGCWFVGGTSGRVTSGCEGY
jgi:hypothetical protein